MQAEESLNSYRQLSGDNITPRGHHSIEGKGTQLLWRNVPAEMSPTYDGMEIKAVKPLNRSSQTMRTALLVLSVLTIYALFTIDYKSVDMPRAFADTISNFKTIFSRPYSHRFSFWEALYEVLVTLGLAFLTTLFGTVIALFLGLLAAQNLSPKRVTNWSKALWLLSGQFPRFYGS